VVRPTTCSAPPVGSGRPRRSTRGASSGPITPATTASPVSQARSFSPAPHPGSIGLVGAFGDHALDPRGGVAAQPGAGDGGDSSAAGPVRPVDPAGRRRPAGVSAAAGGVPVVALQRRRPISRTSERLIERVCVPTDRALMSVDRRPSHVDSLRYLVSVFRRLPRPRWGRRRAVRLSQTSFGGAARFRGPCPEQATPQETRAVLAAWAAAGT
jgi:hypothetical protein